MDSHFPPLEASCWCGGRCKPSVHPLYGQCNECGTQVLLRKFTTDELKDFYSKDYWHEFVKTAYNLPTIEERAINDFYDRIPFYLNLLFRYIKNPQTLLEIGCSHGGFLYFCQKNGIGFVEGIEVDINTCNFAKKRFGLTNITCGFFPDVNLSCSDYDVVVAFDVLEHFINPLQVMKAVAKILNEKGICFFLTPCYRGEDHTWDRFRPDEHLFLYTEDSVKKLFEKCDLEIIDIFPGLYSQDMFIVAKRKADTFSNIKITSEKANLSLIITGKKDSNFLIEALNSCVAQTIKPSEIIIACDIKKETEAQINKFKEYFDIVFLTNSHSKYLSAIRNASIKMAKFPLISFLNEGELLYKNHLETLLPLFESDNLSACYSDSYKAIQVLRGSSYFTFRRELVISNDLNQKQILLENLIPLNCAILRKSVFEELGFFDESLEWCSDWDFWIKFSQKYNALHIKKITCEYIYKADGSLFSQEDRKSYLRDYEIVFKKYNNHQNFSVVNPYYQNIFPNEKPFVLPYPRLDIFMNLIVKMIEQRNIKSAVEYYSKYRPLLPPSPELDRFDEIMKRLLS